jgi:hypothetical protein
MIGEIPENRRLNINKNDYENINSFFESARRILGQEAFNNNEKSNDEITLFEKKHDIKLPHQLKLYFKIINGINDAEWISTLYSLDYINHISEHQWYTDDDNYKSELYKDIYIIGDIMINSHQWGIILNKDGLEEKILEMDTETKIADNISDFLMKFINESPYSLVK